MLVNYLDGAPCQDLRASLPQLNEHDAAVVRAIYEQFVADEEVFYAAVHSKERRDMLFANARRQAAIKVNSVVEDAVPIKNEVFKLTPSVSKTQGSQIGAKCFSTAASRRQKFVEKDSASHCEAVVEELLKNQGNLAHPRHRIQSKVHVILSRCQ